MPMPLQLRSKVTSEGQLELSLSEVEKPVPSAEEVLIRVDATPINPSDLGVVLAMADTATARSSGSGNATVVRINIEERFLRVQSGRFGKPLTIGNEGAGVVVAAGDSPGGQALLGKTVATWGGSMYAHFKTQAADQCLVLNQGTTAEEGASCFVNPLTVLGMLGTMRREGHNALIHTAAASNLGQMLVKACQNEGVELVNIVRKGDQVRLLEGLGAKHVCNSETPAFGDCLTEALIDTGATLGYDAIGGGHMAGRILSAMEAAALARGANVGRYGSTTHKQVYIYGGLDRGPTEFNRSFGMTWGIGGWLLPNYLVQVGPEEGQRMRSQVADEIKTTFASAYTERISLLEFLDIDHIRRFEKQATGEKYLVVPQRDA
jgi:NADPH2:quinone reductase